LALQAKKKCILPIAGVDLAFDFFTLNESTGAKPVKPSARWY
jgi:hypothetical protein